MKVLLDSHALIWFALGDVRTSPLAKSAILDPLHEKLVSAAVFWEIAIKVSIGKLTVHEPYDSFMQRAVLGNGFGILPIELSHTAALINLPYHHRDPFDRLLVAQSTVEGIPIVSSDSTLDKYGITRIW